MPSGTPSSSERPHIRRPRLTTACSACRNRRVKCDRIQPACSQCFKGGKSCHYIDNAAPKVVFVNPPIPRQEQSPGTWRGIIDHQVDVVKSSTAKRDGDPIWAVADAEEASSSHTPILGFSKSLPLEVLGEDFESDLMHNFPDWGICDSALESFLEGVHPLIPICHAPALRLDYLKFKDTFRSNNSVELLALVLAALFTGAANSSPINERACLTFLHLYQQIFTVIDITTYQFRDLGCSIHLLQACVIMNTFKASYLAPFAAYGFLPNVIRFAQSLRLHIEPKKGSSVEKETRRRIWWHLVFLDMESTIATGLPPIIHGAKFTTQLPSIMDDSKNTAESSDTLNSSMTIAMQGHYRWAQKMQIWFEKLPSQAEVTDFKTLLEAQLKLISNQPENQWARVYLMMQIDRTFCTLGLRFWHLDQYKGTGCQSEVVKTARSFLQHYYNLSALSASSKYGWFVPGLVQPLHAIIILLMHISTCTSLQEEESLSRSLLDSILRGRVDRILNPNILSAKIKHDTRANPRYMVLVELRKRVWTKVGWENDGRGLDPWRGSTLDVDGSHTTITTRVPVPVLPSEWNAPWNAEDVTGSEVLDDILAGDPMDLFQWDQWESIAAVFFTA